MGLNQILTGKTTFPVGGDPKKIVTGEASALLQGIIECHNGGFGNPW